MNEKSFIKAKLKGLRKKTEKKQNYGNFSNTYQTTFTMKANKEKTLDEDVVARIQACRFGDI